MKYSVLIPTRNRLEYLKFAVASVLKQNYNDWEVLISDNASEDDISGYVQTLNDPRIKYSRSEKFLTITESWNRSLDMSSGDYVIMLGDDDILLKGYFEITDKLIADYNNPDLIYTNSYLFAYPNVIPNFPKGLFQTFGALNSMPKQDSPFWLDLPSRVAIVRETLKFGSLYSTNMQHALIRRSLVETIKRENKFFHSPYPDVYAMSALFIEAEKVLIYPQEIVVVGVTPKSHGYYIFNSKQKEAVDFLNINNEIASIPGIQQSILPPFNSVHTFWLAAIHLLDKYFPLGKLELKIDYKKYRTEQINNFLRSDRLDQRSKRRQLLKRLSFFEIFLVFSWRALLFYLKKSAPNFVITLYKKLKKIGRKKDKIVVCNLDQTAKENKFSNALEIFEQIVPKL